MIYNCQNTSVKALIIMVKRLNICG